MNLSEETGRLILAATQALSPSTWAGAPAVATLTASTATLLPVSGTPKRGIVLRASDANTVGVYVGSEATITTSAGWCEILNAYEPARLIPITSGPVYVYTTGSSQKIGYAWI